MLHFIVAEYRYRRMDLAGMPLQFLHTIKLGSHHSNWYEREFLLFSPEDEPSAIEIHSVRLDAIATFRRTKIVRKILRRMPIDFHVETP